MIDPAVLELVDATVLKNGTRVLDRLTLTIRAGEHTAILGPNGAGKSALVKLLTHHEYAIAGDAAHPPVRVFGLARWNVSELHSELGIVTDDLHHRFVGGISTGRLTAEVVVVSGLLATQGYVPPDAMTPERRQRAEAALARMDALHLRARAMHEMSTGEARRVVIARALVTTPRALVLDEPTAGLDVVARESFLALIDRIAREGTTVIVVTHHVEEIPPTVERVILLKRGRVAYSGVKHEVLTTTNLSAVFDAPVSVSRVENRYVMRVNQMAVLTLDPAPDDTPSSS